MVVSWTYWRTGGIWLVYVYEYMPNIFHWQLLIIFMNAGATTRPASDVNIRVVRGTYLIHRIFGLKMLLFYKKTLSSFQLPDVSMMIIITRALRERKLRQRAAPRCSVGLRIVSC